MERVLTFTVIILGISTLLYVIVSVIHINVLNKTLDSIYTKYNELQKIEQYHVELLSALCGYLSEDDSDTELTELSGDKISSDKNTKTLEDCIYKRSN